MSSLRLPDRAVHVFFLTRLAKEKAPKGTGCLGDLKTFQVVNELVKPATAKSKMNFIECMLQGRLDKSTLSWCDNGALSDVPGTPRAVGPTTYFVSHAWSYTFSGLIALIERHYAGLPDTNKGKDFVPVFYWVDILAVTQHFTGNFTEHPDSDFPGVIRASKSVLFTMYPWRSPVAPTRVWCLFEALTAVESAGVELEVLLDTGDSKDTGVQTVVAVVSGIDVRSAQASVASDKAFIMGRIRDGIGVEAFNSVLRKRLKEELMAVAATKAIATRDNGSIVGLLKGGGARDPDGTLDVTRWLPHGTAQDVATLLDGLAPPYIPRRLILSGREAGQDEKIHVALKGHRNHVKAPIWSYLPLPGNALAAVGRLLKRQGGDAVGGGGIGGSVASRRTIGSSTLAVPATRVGGAGRGGGAVGVGVRGPVASRRSLAASSSATSNPSDGQDGGARDGDDGSVTSSTTGGLQELWISVAPSYDPRLVSYRPYWASYEYISPEHEAIQGAVDPAWKAAEAKFKRENPKYEYGDWCREFSAHQERWKDSVLAKAQADAEKRIKAELPARLKAETAFRTELWRGLGQNASLTVLGLHRGGLSAKDVAGLAQALSQHRCLQVLQMVDIEPEDGYPEGAGGLARELLAAGLGSRTLQRLLLTPAGLSLLTALEVPAAAAWDLGGGAALQELVLAPVALAPTAVKQLAELLAALPALKTGCVDARKASPRAVVPGIDEKPPRAYNRAELAPVYPNFAAAGSVADLAPVLQLRNLLGRATATSSTSSSVPAVASPAFVSALTHFLAMNTEPAEQLAAELSGGHLKGGVIIDGDHPNRQLCGRDCIRIIVAAEPLRNRWDAKEHSKLLQQSFQAAPPEYQSGVRRWLPWDRASKLLKDAASGETGATGSSFNRTLGGPLPGGSGGRAGDDSDSDGGTGVGYGGVTGRAGGSNLGLGAARVSSPRLSSPRLSRARLNSGRLSGTGLGVTSGLGGSGTAGPTSGLGGAGGGSGSYGKAKPDSDSDDDDAGDIYGGKAGAGGGGGGGRGGGQAEGYSESLRLVIPKW